MELIIIVLIALGMAILLVLAGNVSSEKDDSEDTAEEQTEQGKHK